MGRPARPAGHRRRAVRHPSRDRPALRPGPILEGARPSPNIWHHPATYETENRAFDRARHLEARMREVADWAGRDVLDVGCGTGFHLPLLVGDGAATGPRRAARSVVGVEPHGDLVALARRRVRRLVAAGRAVEVRHGSVTDLPLPDASVDVVHARWSYFLGPGCEPGLAELDRVVRPGGTAFVIDNDPTRSTFGGWFARSFPQVDAEVVERFWAERGWQRHRLDLAWTFDSRADLESVVGLEVGGAVAGDVLAGHEGLVVDYAVNLWWRRY